MPYVKFVIPTAGQRSVTVSGGMSMSFKYRLETATPKDERRKK